jgi:hypothetical protein
MRTLFLLLTGVITTIFSCSQNYVPDGLRKLNDKERLDFIKKNIFPTNQTVLKDPNGNTIEDKSSIDQTEMFYDYYVNDENKILECIVRPKTKEDTELWKQMIDSFQDRDWGAITPKKIDCDKQREVLEKVLEKDQQNRNSGQVIDLRVDKENLEKVLGIIENCGFPTIVSVGQAGMTSTFLVIQHSTRRIREKYLPQIKSCAANGDLSLQEVALMEDRLLMESGEKQKYGTQVTSYNNNGEWKLYPIADIKRVNQRRSTIGLGPLEDYVKQWNIELKIE